MMCELYSIRLAGANGDRAGSKIDTTTLTARLIYPFYMRLLVPQQGYLRVRLRALM